MTPTQLGLATNINVFISTFVRPILTKRDRIADQYALILTCRYNDGNATR